MDDIISEDRMVALVQQAFLQWTITSRSNGSQPRTRASTRTPCPSQRFEAGVNAQWTSNRANSVANRTPQAPGIRTSSAAPTELHSMPTPLASSIDERINQLQEEVRRDVMQEQRAIVPKESPLLAVFDSGGKTAKGYQRQLQLISILRAILEAKRKGRILRVRQLYYDSLAIVESMECVRHWIVQLERLWDCHCSAFNVLPSPKGLVAGPIRLVFDRRLLVDRDRDDAAASFVPTQQTQQTQQTIDAPQYSYTRTKTLIEDVSVLEDLQLSEEIGWVLIVEKETVFDARTQELEQMLLTQNVYAPFTHGLILTGKGFPDQATRRFVKKLLTTLPDDVPFYALVDGDAYGMHIASIYMTIDPVYSKRIQWVGLQPSRWRDIFRDVGYDSSFASSLSDQSFDRSQSFPSQSCSPFQSYFASQSWSASQSLNDARSSLESSRHPYRLMQQHCQPLKGMEIQRAQRLLTRDGLPAVLKREATKLLMLGFRLELEAVESIPLEQLVGHAFTSVRD